MAKITITFDNGPEAKVTHHCLDVLAKHGIKTTFFAIGNKLRDSQNRAALVRAHHEGHWIGNHSYTHSRSLGSVDEHGSLFDEEVTRAQELIAELSHADKLFRPFFNAGVVDNRLFKTSDLARLEKELYTVVFYDTLCGDWGDGEVWVSRALASVERRPWSTLILHDITGYPDGFRTNSMRRLDEFFLRAKDRGHEILQDFDPAQVPMLRGKSLLPMDAWAN